LTTVITVASNILILVHRLLKIHNFHYLYIPVETLNKLFLVSGYKLRNVEKLNVERDIYSDKQQSLGNVCGKHLANISPFFRAPMLQNHAWTVSSL
jgi:hypothetical protein